MNTSPQEAIVETERLLVRQWRPEDWIEARPLFADPRVLAYIARKEPWSDQRIQEFVNGGIEKAKTRGWILWPVIEKKTSALIGFCGFNGSFEPDVEIGWRLIPEYWGRGLATEAARAVMDYGFRTWNFPRLISVAMRENLQSIRIMQKLGMQFDRRFEHLGCEVIAYAIAHPELNPDRDTGF